jgi:tetratricopeptide (TPR) repeat protein
MLNFNKGSGRRVMPGVRLLAQIGEANMKRVLAVFLLLILLASAQNASQASAQSADETKRQATAPVVYSQNAEANELFLKAREYYNKSNPRTGGTLANAREAIKLYEAAVKRDPKFALAYVGLSRAWMRLGYSVPGGMTNKELLPHAKSAALKARKLDKNLLDAHLVLAGIYFNIEFDWEKAEREYKLAVQLAPNDAAVHSSYATYLASMGRFDEAIVEAKKAGDLSQAPATDFALSRIYYRMRRYDEALEYNRRSLNKEESAISHFGLGFVYVAQQKYEGAIAEFKSAVAVDNNGGGLAALAYVYAMHGKRDEALRMLNEITTNPAKLVPYRIAAVYLALGDKDRAIEWLKKDYEVRDNWMTWLKVDPVMDPLRSDPRFVKLMRRMKFR